MASAVPIQSSTVSGYEHTMPSAMTTSADITNAITTSRRRTSSKSPVRSSLGKHIAGSVYCVNAGLHHHTAADLAATKTPPKRTVSRSASASKVQRGRSKTPIRGSTFSTVYNTTHTHVDRHTDIHSTADYNQLVERLERITHLYNQLLADEQSRAQYRHSELEHQRELRLQQRLVDSEGLLRQQLQREYAAKCDSLEQHLAERDALIQQLQTEAAINASSENAATQSLRAELDRLKSEYNTLKHDSTKRYDELIRQCGQLTADNKQLHDDLATVQKNVLTSTEDNIRLRYELRELNGRLHSSETQQQRLERLTREREADEIRLQRLRADELNDHIAREKQLKQQLDQYDAIAERNRRKLQDESKLHTSYYLDGECAWQSGILNRSMLMVPHTNTHSTSYVG